METKGVTTRSKRKKNMETEEIDRYINKLNVF